MLLKTITFDSNNHNWENSREYNVVFLMTVERYLNDIIRHRGYVYLNEIYEKLNVRWNPGDENPCIKNDMCRLAYIQFEILDKPNNSFLLHIHRYD